MSDDTSTLQKRIEKACKADMVYELNGEFRISDTIVIPPSEGLHVRGFSMAKTGIYWEGPSDRPMFVMRDVRDSVFENFFIEAHTGLLNVFEVGRYNTAPGATVTTNNHRKRLAIRGNGLIDTYVQHGGMGHDGWAYPNVNNEANLDEDCSIRNVKYGIKYIGNQCKLNVINRCRFEGLPTSEDAVYSTGSFMSYGGGGYGWKTFFHQADIVDVGCIFFPDVEACQRFLVATGPGGIDSPTGAPMGIAVLGGRFMCDALHTDRRAIIIMNGGDLKLHTFQLGLGAQPIPIIALTSFQNVFNVENVDFGSNGSSPGNSFFAGGIPHYESIGWNTYRHTDSSTYKVYGMPLEFEAEAAGKEK